MNSLPLFFHFSPSLLYNNNNNNILISFPPSHFPFPSFFYSQLRVLVCVVSQKHVAVKQLKRLYQLHKVKLPSRESWSFGRMPQQPVIAISLKVYIIYESTCTSQYACNKNCVCVCVNARKDCRPV